MIKARQHPPSMSCAQMVTKLALLSFVLILLLTHDELSCSHHGIFSSSSQRNENGLILPQDDPHLASLLQVSAFDKSLYDAFHHPYNTYPCQPRKIHLSPASNVDHDSGRVNMTLSFSLNRTQCSSNQPSPSSLFSSSSNVRMVIVYGRGVFPEGRIEQRAADAEHSVHFDFVSPVTGEHYQSDWIQHVELPHLMAGSHLYWYRIIIQQEQQQQHGQHLPHLPSFRPVFLRGSLYKMGESPTYRFRTPPLYHQPTSLALVGDLGQTENSTKTMNRILQAATLDSVGGSQAHDNLPPPVTQLLIAGDLSYADGVPERWDSWLELMQPLLQTLPLASIPGNHEIECDNITHNVFVPYESQFRNPNRIANPDMQAPSDTYIDTLWHRMCNAPSQFLGHYNFGNAFYQYQHGLVHIIALNSYTSILPGSLQYDWLTKVALPSVNRQETPWLLVMFHCPLYTTFVGHNDEVNPTLMKSSIQDLLKQHKVNLVVSGHDHAYLRTHPVHHDHVDPTGQSPMYWTLGAGGNREQHTKGYIHDTPEEWVAKRDNDEYGYGHFFAKNRTHAHLQWVRDGTSSSEIVRDSVWVENYYYYSEKLN